MSPFGIFLKFQSFCCGGREAILISGRVDPPILWVLLDLICGEGDREETDNKQKISELYNILTTKK